eukprot:3892870-Pleurochrysis_carterae.AAC.1
MTTKIVQSRANCRPLYVATQSDGAGAWAEGAQAKALNKKCLMPCLFRSLRPLKKCLLPC